MSKNYIPGKQEEFDKFFKELVQFVVQRTTGSYPQWTHIPKADVDGLNVAYAAWNTAYSLTFKAHTSVETKQKNRVKKASESKLRKFVTRFLRHEPVTDMERDAMHIPNRGTVKTPVKVPHEKVEFTLEQSGAARIVASFKVKGSPSKAKPHGYNGVFFKWLVSDKSATKVSELTEHGSAPKSPFVLKLKDEDRGKVISLAAQWENKKYEKGPWSPIQWTIVP
jgi:hypothetical protein